MSQGTVRQAHEKVVKEEAGRLGIVREILRKSTGFLRRSIAPVGGRGGVTLSYVCPHYNSFPLEDKKIGGYRRRRNTAVGVQSVEKEMNGEHPTGFR